MKYDAESRIHNDGDKPDWMEYVDSRKNREDGSTGLDCG